MFGEDEKTTLARMKYSMAKEFGEMVGRFARDLREGRNSDDDKDWWARFETAIRWFADFANADNWMLGLQMCHDVNPAEIATGVPGVKKALLRGVEVEIDMRPWKNREFWQPFVRTLYADLIIKFKEEGDMLSLLGFMTGYGLKERKPDLPATDLKRYFDSLMGK